MIGESDVTYRAETKEKREELEKLYNEFVGQYSIALTKGKLIVIESSNRPGIEISPEKNEGEIVSILALKPVSELEIKLFKHDFTCGFSIFKTKNNNYITLNNKKQ